MSSLRSRAVPALVLATLCALNAPSPVLASDTQESPLVTIELPVDTTAPVIANLMMDGHHYRMMVDTGAGDLVFHLPIARRDLIPASHPQQPMKGEGLHGDIELHSFRSSTFKVGNWTVQTRGEVLAADMSRLVQDYGIDGVLGSPYLSQLSWHWDNRARKLSGYQQDARIVTDTRERMQCTRLIDVDGNPGVSLDVAGESVAFALDTGNLAGSGGIRSADLEAYKNVGAIMATASVDGHVDMAGHPLPPVQIIQLQTVRFGETKLDGLMFGEISNNSRLGLGFFVKFDEVLLDFGTGKFCTSPVNRLDPDTLAPWQ